MFISVRDQNKTFWTHSSLISEEKAHAIQKIHDQRPGFQNKASFVSTYLSLEFVNRLSILKKQTFYARAGVVAAAFLGSRILSGAFYNQSIDKLVKKNLDGAPIWENKIEVPELDKKFFFLDDDNNFEPSLWHHGVVGIEKPKKYYSFEHQ